MRRVSPIYSNKFRSRVSALQIAHANSIETPIDITPFVFELPLAILNFNLLCHYRTVDTVSHKVCTIAIADIPPPFPIHLVNLNLNFAIINLFALVIDHYQIKLMFAFCLDKHFRIRFGQPHSHESLERSTLHIKHICTEIATGFKHSSRNLCRQHSRSLLQPLDVFDKSQTSLRIQLRRNNLIMQQWQYRN